MTTATTEKPYGYTIVFTRFAPNQSFGRATEEVTLTRKGTEQAARRAAGLTKRFHQVISVTPIPMSAAPAPRPRKSHAAPEIAPTQHLPMPRWLPPSDPSSTPETLTPSVTTQECDRAPLDQPTLPRPRAINGTVTDAMDEVRLIARDLADLAEKKRSLLAQMEDRLDIIARSTPKSGVEPLQARCERLRGLFNQEELGSWRLQIERIMEAAHNRLFE